MSSQCNISRFSLMPTVCQSLLSPTSPTSQDTSPITPLLRVDMDRIPFSQSFPSIMRFSVASLRESSCARMARVSRDRVISQSDSFYIEHIPNVKEIDPDWEHDEIEEIMVISAKPRARNSFLDLGESNTFNMNDFEVLRVVGKEPSVQTVLARSCSDFGIYAIKTLGKRSASSRNLLKRVRSEQACLRIVTEGDCPFLPKLHRSFHDEARLYMVLDTYPGGSLAMQLEHERPFASGKARFYASEVVEALSFLYSLRVVHRDIKPENIMIAADGHIVLANFSCAKVLDESESTSSDCGTREFEAPERILGWTYDYTADIWSFGILLCIMHFGQHPFLEGDELDPVLIMQKRILRGQAPKCPAGIVPLSEWDLVKTCLEPNAHLRPNITQIKSHKYFSDINWDRVKTKQYPAPYVPYGFEVDLLGADENVFHYYSKSDLRDLDDSATLDLSDFTGFAYTWQPASTSPGNVTLSDAILDPVTPGKASTRKKHVRSILKNPSRYFAGEVDPARHADFLDLTCSPESPPRICLGSTPLRPRKLRKKRFSGAPALSPRRSIVSLLSDLTPSRKTDKKRGSCNRFLGGCERSMSSSTINLPKDVIQTGGGIGFTRASYPTHSHSSLVSVKSRTCFKSISVLLRRRGKLRDDLAKEGGQDMRHIYGSTWSISTNSAQKSTFSLGVPDGRGTTVDSVTAAEQRPS